MNELLQKHGCANVFSLPEGLKELMSDISREVLREQPPKLFEFIANYLSCLLITREHGILSLRVLDDLCDCKPTVKEKLQQLDLSESTVNVLASIIKQGIEGTDAEPGKESLREAEIIKECITVTNLDELNAAHVCNIIRNAYRDYWYRKNLLQKSLKPEPEEPWEIAAEHTLQIYKNTKPSFTEMNRAAVRIQAAYRGYYVRKNLLEGIKKHAKCRPGPKVRIPGPPLDIASSREINLGPMIEVEVKKEDVGFMFKEEMADKLGIAYDHMSTITHVTEEEEPKKREGRGISFSSQKHGKFCHGPKKGDGDRRPSNDRRE